MEILESLDIMCWQGPFSPEIVLKSADTLEMGKLLYAPRLPFELSEAECRFLSPDCLDGTAKNISYRPGSGALKGTSCRGTGRDPERSPLRLLERLVGRDAGVKRDLMKDFLNARR
jgi:hypothetical protein